MYKSYDSSFELAVDLPSDVKNFTTPSTQRDPWAALTDSGVFTPGTCSRPDNDGRSSRRSTLRSRGFNTAQVDTIESAKSDILVACDSSSQRKRKNGRGIESSMTPKADKCESDDEDLSPIKKRLTYAIFEGTPCVSDCLTQNTPPASESKGKKQRSKGKANNDDRELGEKMSEDGEDQEEPASFIRKRHRGAVLRRKKMQSCSRGLDLRESTAYKTGRKAGEADGDFSPAQLEKREKKTRAKTTKEKVVEEKKKEREEEVVNDRVEKGEECGPSNGRPVARDGETSTSESDLDEFPSFSTSSSTGVIGEQVSVLMRRGTMNHNVFVILFFCS